jgi:hypothetical protein
MIRHFQGCLKSAATNTDGESEFQSSHCDELRRLSLSVRKLLWFLSSHLLCSSALPATFFEDAEAPTMATGFLKRGEKALMASSFCSGFPDFKKT